MSELRPSFEERDRYLDLLSQSYANGRLDDQEFARRSQGVLGAVTHRDAMAYFDGLPQPAVVPAQPAPPPPRPTVYQPVVDPRAQQGSSDMTRRVLMGAAAGVGLLAIVGVFGITARVDDASGPFTEFSEEMMPIDGAGLTIDGIFIDGVEQATSSLAERGLTHVQEWSVSRSGIQGLAAPASTGDPVEFMQEPRGSLTTSATQAVAGRALELGRLETMVPLAVDAAVGQLSGVVVDLELLWGSDDEPLVRVVAADGARTGFIEVAESGAVVDWQEMR